MMPILCRASALVLFGFIASFSLDAAADSFETPPPIFPGWNAIPSTNWEVESPSIQNWRQMLTRWADGKDCNSETCSSAGWAALVAQVKAAGDVVAQVKAANSLINDTAQHPYKFDFENWNADEYWETPYEFLKKSGDAEDFAIAKYFLLKAAGVPVNDMQIIMVRVESQGGIGHAMLAVRADSTLTFVLDDRVLYIKLRKEFDPVLGVNEGCWFAYTPRK